MTLADMVRAMQAGGCSAEQIVSATAAWDEARRARTRDGNRERQAAWRARNANNGVTGVTEHNGNNANNGVTGRDTRAGIARVEESSLTEESPGKNQNSLTSFESFSHRKKKSKNPDVSPRDVLLECLQPETADAVLAHRRAKRCPLTPYAARLLVKGFNATADPEDAAQTMIARGWQGFKVEWYDKDKGNGEQRSKFAVAGERILRRLDDLYADRREGRDASGDPPVRLFPRPGSE
jgi:hypothetical protein